jgi:hypothetical protein
VRLPQVGDEVLDIRRSDFGEGTIAEVLDDRPEPVVNPDVTKTQAARASR